MAKYQRRKHIKKLQPKAKLEPWEKHTDKNVEFHDDINQRELSNTETEQRIDNLKRRINLLNIQIDGLIWRVDKLAQIVQELERGRKSRIVIFAIICLWLVLLDRASKSTTEETFIFQFVVGVGLITVAVYEAMRD